MNPKYTVILFEESDKCEVGEVITLPFAPYPGLWIENPFNQDLCQIESVYWVDLGNDDPRSLEAHFEAYLTLNV